MSISNEETDLIYSDSAKNALSFFVVLWQTTERRLRLRAWFTYQNDLQHCYNKIVVDFDETTKVERYPLEFA